MSRLFRGRKLLQKTLREYAEGQGVLSKPAEAGLGQVSVLEEYRRRKKTA